MRVAWLVCVDVIVAGVLQDCHTVRVIGWLRDSGRRTPQAPEQHDDREHRLHEPIIAAPAF